MAFLPTENGLGAQARVKTGVGCKGRGGVQRPGHRGTSLIRNRLHLGPYSKTMARALWKGYGGLRFLTSDVALQGAQARDR